MSTFDRWIKNLSATPLATRRRFPTHALRSIEKAITTVESKHAGEIRFVIETALDLGDLWARRTPRQRAVELFGRLGVWDTERNNGVLIYLLMAEHDVEIVADRGIAATDPQDLDRIDCQVDDRGGVDAGRPGIHQSVDPL